jgi:hypothetical protein
MDQLPSSTSRYFYDLACYHALFSGAASRPGSGRSADEALAHGEEAMHWLRKTVVSGHVDFAYFRTDTDLDPLRDRPDFQMLLMDLAFPADPFCTAQRRETAVAR